MSSPKAPVYCKRVSLEHYKQLGDSETTQQLSRLVQSPEWLALGRRKLQLNLWKGLLIGICVGAIVAVLVCRLSSPQRGCLVATQIETCGVSDVRDCNITFLANGDHVPASAVEVVDDSLLQNNPSNTPPTGSAVMQMEEYLHNHKENHQQMTKGCVEVRDKFNNLLQPDFAEHCHCKVESVVQIVEAKNRSLLIPLECGHTKEAYDAVERELRRCKRARTAAVSSKKGLLKRVSQLEAELEQAHQLQQSLIKYPVDQSWWLADGSSFWNFSLCFGTSFQLVAFCVSTLLLATGLGFALGTACCGRGVGDRSQEAVLKELDLLLGKQPSLAAQQHEGMKPVDISEATSEQAALQHGAQNAGSSKPAASAGIPGVAASLSEIVTATLEHEAISQSEVIADLPEQQLQSVHASSTVNTNPASSACAGLSQLLHVAETGASAMMAIVRMLPPIEDVSPGPELASLVEGDWVAVFAHASHSDGACCIHYPDCSCGNDACGQEGRCPSLLASLDEVVDQQRMATEELREVFNMIKQACGLEEHTSGLLQVQDVVRSIQQQHAHLVEANARCVELARLRQQLQARLEHARTEEASLLCEEKEIMEMEEGLLRMDAWARKKQDALELQQSELQVLNCQVEEQQAAVEELKARVAKHEELKQMQVELLAEVEQMEMTRAQLTARQEELQTLEAQVKGLQEAERQQMETGRQLREAEQQLEEKQAELGSLQAVVDALTAVPQKVDVHQQVAKEQILPELQAAVQQQKAMLAESDSAIAGLEGLDAVLAPKCTEVCFLLARKQELQDVETNIQELQTSIQQHACTAEELEQRQQQLVELELEQQYLVEIEQGIRSQSGVDAQLVDSQEELAGLKAATRELGAAGAQLQATQAVLTAQMVLKAELDEKEQGLKELQDFLSCWNSTEQQLAAAYVPWQELLNTRSALRTASSAAGRDGHDRENKTLQTRQESAGDVEDVHDSSNGTDQTQQESGDDGGGGSGEQECAQECLESRKQGLHALTVVLEEHHELVDNLLAKQQELEQLSRDVSQARELDSQLACQHLELQQLQASLSEKQHCIQELQALIAEKQHAADEVSSKQDELAQLQERVSQGRQAAEQVEVCKAELQQLEPLLQNLTDVAQQLDAAKRQLARLGIDVESAAALQRSLEAKQQQLMDLNAAIAQTQGVQQQLETKQQELQSKNQEMASKQQELDRQEHELNQLQQLLEQERAFTDRRIVLQQELSGFSDTMEEAQVLAQQVSSKEEELQSLKSKVDRLHDLQQELETKQRYVQEVQQEIDMLQGTVQHLPAVQQELGGLEVMVSQLQVSKQAVAAQQQDMQRLMEEVEVMRASTQKGWELWEVARRDAEEAQGQLDSKQQELQSKQQELQQLEHELMELKPVEEQLAAKRAEVSQLDQLAQELHAAEVHVGFKHAQLDKVCASVQHMMGMLKQSAAAVHLHIDVVRQGVEDVELAFNKAKEVEDCVKQQQELLERHQEVAEQLQGWTARELAQTNAQQGNCPIDSSIVARSSGLLQNVGISGWLPAEGGMLLSPKDSEPLTKQGSAMLEALTDASRFASSPEVKMEFCAKAQELQGILSTKEELEREEEKLSVMDKVAEAEKMIVPQFQDSKKRVKALKEMAELVPRLEAKCKELAPFQKRHKELVAQLNELKKYRQDTPTLEAEYLRNLKEVAHGVGSPLLSLMSEQMTALERVNQKKDEVISQHANQFKKKDKLARNMHKSTMQRKQALCAIISNGSSVPEVLRSISARVQQVDAQCWNALYGDEVSHTNQSASWMNNSSSAQQPYGLSQRAAAGASGQLNDEALEVLPSCSSNLGTSAMAEHMDSPHTQAVDGLMQQTVQSLTHFENLRLPNNSIGTPHDDPFGMLPENPFNMPDIGSAIAHPETSSPAVSPRPDLGFSPDGRHQSSQSMPTFHRTDFLPTPAPH